MTEGKKAKIEAALECVFRSDESVVFCSDEGSVEIRDEHGVETLTADGQCTCGEERCVHRMARQFGRMIFRIEKEGDTRRLLRHEPAEVLLAATVIFAVRATEERELEEAMHTPPPEPSMPWGSVIEAMQHHQHVQRVMQENEARTNAVRDLNCKAYMAAGAFVRLLEELDIRGGKDVFAYVYRDREHRVSLDRVAGDSGSLRAHVELTEESLARTEA